MDTTERIVLADRYELGRLLGRGGMAEVFEAVDLRLLRPVAVKVLQKRFADDPATKARFEHEAKAAAKLTHPNVVGIYDTGESDGRAFLVMERLPGRTLADEVADGRGETDTRWVLRIAGDVLGALGAAHDAGIVHRDIKPANILLADNGCAKVADFGIAKSLESAESLDLTTAGLVVGTPAYVAPERIDDAPATARSDLYSVAVMLYEALAGRRPFTGSSAVAVATAVRDGHHEPLGEIRPDLPAALVETIERTLSRDPASRPQTAPEMASQLGCGLSGDTDTVNTDTVAFAAGASGIRSEDPLATSVMASAPLLEPPVATAPAARPSLTGRPRTPSTGARRATGSTMRWLQLTAAVLLGIGVLILGAALVGGNDRDTPASAAQEASPLGNELRAVAERLAVGDGPRGAEAATRLRQIADLVDGGGGSAEATALLADVAAWRDSKELGTSAAALAIDVLSKVPGAQAPAATPTTQPPPVVDKDEDDDKPGKGKGKDKDD